MALQALKAKFAEFGSIVSVRVISNSSYGTNNYAYVNFELREDGLALRALLCSVDGPQRRRQSPLKWTTLAGTRAASCGRSAMSRNAPPSPPTSLSATSRTTWTSSGCSPSSANSAQSHTARLRERLPLLV